MPTVRRFRMKVSPTRGARWSSGSMDRKPELPEGGACMVSLPVAGWSKPADTWRKSRKGQVYVKGPKTPPLLPDSTRDTQGATHGPSHPHARLQGSEKHYRELKFCGSWWDVDGNADLANPVGVLLKVGNF